MTGLQLSGLASGRETDAIISQLMFVYGAHTSVATAGLPGRELTPKSTGTVTLAVSGPAAGRAQAAAELKGFVSA